MPKLFHKVISFYHQIFPLLSPVQWFCNFLLLSLAQLVVWVAWFFLTGVDRESIEQRLYFMGFTLIPFLSIVLLLIGAVWIYQRKASLQVWSHTLIAFQLSFVVLIGVMAQARLFTPENADAVLLARMADTSASLENVQVSLEQVRTSYQQLSALGRDLVRLSLLSYVVGFVVVHLALGLFRLAWLRVGLASFNVLLYMPLLVGIVHLESVLLPIERSAYQEIRVPQTGYPDVYFAWLHNRIGCMEYRFSGEGAQAIYLGAQGLAHLAPINVGTQCQEVPMVLRIINAQGLETRYLVAYQPIALDILPVAVLMSVLGVGVLYWGGYPASLGFAVLALAYLFSPTFILEGVSSLNVLGISTILAAGLMWVSWRGSRWFDVTFALLIIGLCINLGFTYDQFHFHSGWMGTLNAMLHGESLMVDVFSQRGLLSMVTLAGAFSILPLTYPVFALLISSLLALQFMALYALIRYFDFGRYWAVVTVLAALVLHIYWNDLRPLRQPGFSPLRFGHIYLLAGVMAWRFTSKSRLAQLVERLTLAFCVLWSIDTAMIVIVAYGLVSVVEAYQRYHMSRASMMWLVRHLAWSVLTIVTAFGLIHSWLWISTGKLPRWDFYWAFFEFHAEHGNYQVPIVFWSESWWLVIVPLFVGLFAWLWRMFIGNPAEPPKRQELLVGLIILAGIMQFYHYISQSWYPNNHIVASMLSLGYLLSLMKVQRNLRLWRTVWLTLVLSLMGLTFFEGQVAQQIQQSPPLIRAIPQLAIDFIQGKETTLKQIQASWESFEQARPSIYISYNPSITQYQDSPIVAETVALVERYSPEQKRLDLYMNSDDLLHSLLILQAAHRYPITFPPHDTRVADLVDQVLATPIEHQVGDLLYVQNAPIQLRETHPMMPIILAKLCQAFDFELIETSLSGMNVIRLATPDGTNELCEAHGWA